MVLFSATYNEEVMKFASMVIPDPVIMRLKRNEESLDNIKQVRPGSKVTPEKRVQTYLASSMWHVRVKMPSLKLSAIFMESSPLARPWFSARYAGHTLYLLSW